MSVFNKLLFAVDLRDLDQGSLERAYELSTAFGADIHFLHVHSWSPLPFPDEALMLGTPMGEGMPLPSPEVQNLIDAIQGLLPKACSAHCHFSVQTGNLVDVVEEYVIQEQIDLVVTEHRHDNSFVHWLFRSGDEMILSSVQVPVLVLPRRES